MKQVLQSLKDGTTEVAEVPAPQVLPGHVLVRSRASLVSAGTERMLVEFGRASWLAKARQQPDKVRMVLDKIRSDGLAPTLDAIRSKLDLPLATGYCNVGTVERLGAGIEGLHVGERVACNGPHAEFACVPKNLCVRIPDAVDDEAAAFTVLAAIGLQGLRLAQPTLGECVVVTGLGVIGLLLVQMLRAQGCRVLGIDPDPARRALAERFGAHAHDSADAEAVLAGAREFSRGRGVDAVLITASTRSSEPVHQAAQMCRQRGRIVLVGVVGLELSRADFYAKELSFQVSCSYGPGRYDPGYEQGGHDYPVGFVRWTEQRNFEAALDLMASGALVTDALVSHRLPLERAAEAYGFLADGAPSLGIILRHAEDPAMPRATPVQSIAIAPAGRRQAATGAPRLAFLGAGNYAGRVLIPAFARSGAALATVVSAGGVSAMHAARKHGFAAAASSVNAVLEDGAVDAVVIATRHDLHAGEVLAALRAGKHVFCEKPLCLTHDELADIEDFYAGAGQAGPELMVGFNRRFAPHVARMRALLAPLDAPMHLVATINAGRIPAGHWTQDPRVGGGRLLGEGCHFVDLLRFLAGAPIRDFQATALGIAAGPPLRDSATVTLRFANGSRGTIHYFANGDKAFPKERVEAFCAGRVLQLDNFRVLRGWGWRNFRRMRLWRQDKGQDACAAAFVAMLRDGTPAPIPRAEIFEVSRAAIAIQTALA